MATIIIITPPTKPKSANLAEPAPREFERPDGEPLADSLRAIADQIEAEG
jgi:hypothetical protein